MLCVELDQVSRARLSACVMSMLVPGCAIGNLCTPKFDSLQGRDCPRRARGAISHKVPRQPLKGPDGAIDELLKRDQDQAA